MLFRSEFYFPFASDFRRQSATNRQGGAEELDFDVATGFVNSVIDESDEAYQLYTKMIDSGMSREQARMILPLNLYTEWFWKIDLHNLFHFLALRADSHAQKEIRVYANAIIELLRQVVPVAVEAWEDYHPMRGAIKLTRLEVEALSGFIRQNAWHLAPPQIDTDNKRERAEWLEKARLLGLNVPEPEPRPLA